MAGATWNETVIDGVRYLVISVAQLRIPLDWDPSSNVFIAVAAPTGGVLNYPALVAGDDGATPDIDNVINFTPLAHGDPTADFASWTETSPNVYKMNLGLHVGTPGIDGTASLDPTLYGTPLPGQILVVNGTSDGFQYQTQKVGDFYVPGVIHDLPTGNPAFTLAVVSFTPKDFDWRPSVTGFYLFSSTVTDTGYDVIARLNGESGGNIVGRGIGGIGTVQGMVPLIDGPPSPTYNDAYDRVLAGAAATIHFRAERRVGTSTLTGSGSNGQFRAKVNPIP